MASAARMPSQVAATLIFGRPRRIRASGSKMLSSLPPEAISAPPS